LLGHWTEERRMRGGGQWGLNICEKGGGKKGTSPENGGILMMVVGRRHFKDQ